MQEHATAELSLLHGDLRGEMNRQETRLCVVEKSVSDTEEAISINVGLSVAVEESVANTREQIISEA